MTRTGFAAIAALALAGCDDQGPEARFDEDAVSRIAMQRAVADPPAAADPVPTVQVAQLDGLRSRLDELGRARREALGLPEAAAEALELDEDQRQERRELMAQQDPASEGMTVDPASPAGAGGAQSTPSAAALGETGRLEVEADIRNRAEGYIGQTAADPALRRTDDSVAGAAAGEASQLNAETSPSAQDDALSGVGEAPSALERPPAGSDRAPGRAAAPSAESAEGGPIPAEEGGTLSGGLLGGQDDPEEDATPTPDRVEAARAAGAVPLPDDEAEAGGDRAARPDAASAGADATRPAQAAAAPEADQEGEAAVRGVTESSPAAAAPGGASPAARLQAAEGVDALGEAEQVASPVLTALDALKSLNGRLDSLRSAEDAETVAKMRDELQVAAEALMQAAQRAGVPLERLATR